MEELKMPEKFSFSKLNTFNQCPFKYKLVYIDKNFIFTSNLSTEFGTLIHYIQCEIGKCLKNNQSVDYTYFKNLFYTLNDEQNNVYGINKLIEKYGEEAYYKKSNNLSFKEKEEIFLSTGIYSLENILMVNPSYEIVDVELKFEFPFNDYIFTGAIDRLLYDKNTHTYIIQDIKTYTKKETIQDDKHLLQFVVYMFAVKHLYKDADNILMQYDLTLLDEIQNIQLYNNEGTFVLLDLLKKVEISDYHPIPSPLCHWCPFCETFPNQPKQAKNKCFYYSLWKPEDKTRKVKHYWEGLKKHNEYIKMYTHQEIVSNYNPPIIRRKLREEVTIKND